MKNLLWLIMICGSVVCAQNNVALNEKEHQEDTLHNNSVEALILGAQVGIIGIWGYTEYRLHPQIALRGELGFHALLFGGDAYGGNGFLIVPMVAVEPKWYYDLDNRVSWYKDIAYNSGDFLSLRVGYNMGWGAITGRNGSNVASSISVIPTWGMRRNVSEKFNIELAGGVGYVYVFSDNPDVSVKQGNVAINLQVRVGYRLISPFK